MARLVGRPWLFFAISMALPLVTAAERDSAASRAASASKVREDLLAAVVTAPGPMYKQPLKHHSTAHEEAESLTAALDADETDIESLLSAALPQTRSLRSGASSVDGSEVSSTEKVAGLMKVAELAEQKAALVEASLAQVETSGGGEDAGSRVGLARKVNQLINVARVARSKAKETEQAAQQVAALAQAAAKVKNDPQEADMSAIPVPGEAFPPPKDAATADAVDPKIAKLLLAAEDAREEANANSAASEAFPQVFLADNTRNVLPHTQQEFDEALKSLESAGGDIGGLLQTQPGHKTVGAGTAAVAPPVPHQPQGPNLVQASGTETAVANAVNISSGDDEEIMETENSSTTGTHRRRVGTSGGGLNGTSPQSVPEEALPESVPTQTLPQSLPSQEKTNEMRLKAALENKTMVATDALKMLESQDQKLKEMVTAAEDVAEEKARIAMEMAKLEIQQHKRQADQRLDKVKDAVLGRIKAVKPAPLPEITPACLEPQVQNVTDETLAAWKKVTEISDDLEAALRQLSLLEARLASEQGKVSILKARELTKQVEKEASGEVEQYMHTWSRKLARTQESIHEELNRTMMSMNKRMGCDKGTPLDYGGFWHGSIKLADGAEAKEFLFTINPAGEGDSGTVTWSAPDLYDSDRSIPYTVCECGQIEMKVKGSDDMLIGKLVSKDKLVWSDRTMWERRHVVQMTAREKVVAKEESPGPSAKSIAYGQGTRWLSMLLLSAAMSYFV